MKRSLDFDPLHSPGGSPKRRRCLANVSPSTSSHIGCRQTSPFSSVTPKISPSQLAQNICQEWKRIKRRKRLEESFPEDATVSHPPVTSQMLYPSFPPTQTSSSIDTFSPAVAYPSPSSFNFTSSPSHHQTTHEEASGSSRGKEQPLFTLSQVIMICERMLKEQESRIKEEYDKVLSCKLAEQYDSFVRFNQDQMRRRFGENTASYVSWKDI